MSVQHLQIFDAIHSCPMGMEKVTINWNVMLCEFGTGKNPELLLFLLSSIRCALDYKKHKTQ